MSDQLLRSLMFVPGHNERFIANARQLDADAFVFDFEDSVAFDDKASARAAVRDALSMEAFPVPVFVRVNALDSGMLLDDLRAAVHAHVYGIMFSKVHCANDVLLFERLLNDVEAENGVTQGSTRILSIVESASGMLNVAAIAHASTRNVGLVFGSADYTCDVDGLPTPDRQNYIAQRALVVAAARAAEIMPIDTAHFDVRDDTGFLHDARVGRACGFSGKAVIHPSQIAPANTVFAPSPEEIAHAQRVVDAVEATRAAGDGVTVLDGRLVGPPMEKRARQVLAKAVAARGES